MRTWSDSQSTSLIWINIPLGYYHIYATDLAACNDTIDIILSCSDGDPCTIDECSGACSHSFKCEDNDPCTEDFCQPDGECSNQSLVCDDGDPCTQDDCLGGSCQNVAVDCADNNDCTVDQCFNGNCMMGGYQDTDDTN